MMGGISTSLRRAAWWSLRIAVLAAVTSVWVPFTLWWFPPIVEGVQSLTWPSTEGRLLSASVMEQYGGGRRSSGGTRMGLSYSFETRDDAGQIQRHRGSRFNAADYRGSWPIFQRGIVMETMRHPDRLPVYYDPREPTRSVLHPGIAVETLLLAFLWVPLSLLAFHCWRHALAPAFWQSLGRAFSTDGTIPWRTRITAAMAGLGVGGYIILFKLSLAYGRLAPAWAMGLILSAFLGALIFPKKVEAAFTRKFAQGLGFALVALFLIVGNFPGLLVGRFDPSWNPPTWKQRPAIESYQAPLEKLAQAMNSPHSDLKSWALDHLRMYPRGEEQIPLVRQGLKDPHPSVRWQAIGTISTMGPSAQALVPDVVPLLEDTDGKIQSEALDLARRWVGIDRRVDQSNRLLPAPILTWTPDEVELLTAPLRRLGENPDPRVRNQASQLLAHIAAAQRRTQKSVPR